MESKIIDYSFTQEEQETIITTDALDKAWNVYTRQQKVMTKMARLGVLPYRVVTNADGRIIEAEYTLALNQVSFRNSRVLSEDQRQQIADRFRIGRENNAI